MNDSVEKLAKRFINADNQALLETKVVSAYTGMSISWFNNKAVYGGGVPYIKTTNKRLYCKADVLDWMEKNFHKATTTADYIKKTEITRPIQEATEADIGKLCAFWDYKEEIRYGRLNRIIKLEKMTFYSLENIRDYCYARRLTKQEIEELC